MIMKLFGTFARKRLQRFLFCVILCLYGGFACPAGFFQRYFALQIRHFRQISKAEVKKKGEMPLRDFYGTLYEVFWKQKQAITIHS